MRLVARASLLEARRRRGSWSAAVLLGAMFSLFLLAVGSIGEVAQERADARQFRVSIAGDLDGAQQTLRALDSPRFVFRPSDDPVTDVIERRSRLGIEFPEGVDRALEAGEAVELRLAYRVTEPISVEAFQLAGIALRQVELEAISVDATPQLSTAVSSITEDDRVGRVRVARQLSAVAALLCLGVITTTGAFFGAARETRSLEALLVLPVSREAIASGVATGVLPVAVVQISAGLLVVVAAALVPGTTLYQPTATVLMMAAGILVPTALLAATACATGALAGALGRGADDSVSIGDLLGVPYMGVAIALLLTPSLPATVITGAVPVLGQALAIREMAAGTIGIGFALAAVVSAVVWSAVLVRLAGGRLARDGAALRISR